MNTHTYACMHTYMHMHITFMHTNMKTHTSTFMYIYNTHSHAHMHTLQDMRTNLVYNFKSLLKAFGYLLLIPIYKGTMPIFKMNHHLNKYYTTNVQKANNHM